MYCWSSIPRPPLLRQNLNDHLFDFFSSSTHSVLQFIIGHFSALDLGGLFTLHQKWGIELGTALIRSLNFVWLENMLSRKLK